METHNTDIPTTTTKTRTAAASLEFIDVKLIGFK